MTVSDKFVAVTGGCGGLGAAIVHHLASRGATVLALDLPEAIGAQDERDRVVPIAVDVTDEHDVAAAFAQIGRTTGRLDGLVVAAGIQLHDGDGKVGTVGLDVWQRTMDVNLTGTFLSVRQAIPLLLAAPASSLVLIGSPTGLTMSGAGYSAYSASKAGMMALARVVAADYAGDGLRANVVVPGTMRTPLIEPLLADHDSHARLLAGLPVGRLGEPEEVTGVVGWLLSDDSRFATGGFFPVDGGLTAR